MLHQSEQITILIDCLDSHIVDSVNKDLKTDNRALGHWHYRTLWLHNIILYLPLLATRLLRKFSVVPRVGDDASVDKSDQADPGQESEKQENADSKHHSTLLERVRHIQNASPNHRVQQEKRRELGTNSLAMDTLWIVNVLVRVGRRCRRMRSVVVVIVVVVGVTTSTQIHLLQLNTHAHS